MKIEVEFEGTTLVLSEENIKDMLEVIYMNTFSENKEEAQHAKNILEDINGIYCKNTSTSYGPNESGKPGNKDINCLSGYRE